MALRKHSILSILKKHFHICLASEFAYNIFTDMTIEPFCIINKDWIELTCKTSFFQLLPTKGGENGVWKAQEEEDESFRVIILNCQKTVMEKCVSEVAWSMRTEEGQRLRQILTQREKYAGQGVTKQQLKAPIAFPQTIGGPLRRKTTHWHLLCISYSLLNILNYQYIRFLPFSSKNIGFWKLKMVGLNKWMVSLKNVSHLLINESSVMHGW